MLTKNSGQVTESGNFEYEVSFELGNLLAAEESCQVAICGVRVDSGDVLYDDVSATDKVRIASTDGYQATNSILIDTTDDFTSDQSVDSVRIVCGSAENPTLI